MIPATSVLEFYGYDTAQQPQFFPLEPGTDGLVRALDGLLSSSQRYLRRYEMYYEGEQPIRFLAPAMMREFGKRMTSLVLNWCRLGADAYENRLDVEGFRYAGQDSSDDALWEVWQANNLDEQSQQGHLDSIVLGRSYVIVGKGDAADDPPIVSVESAAQVFAVRDPRTRRVRAALKRWSELDGSRWAVLYEPNVTTTLTFDAAAPGWRTVNTDTHELGRVPVVPLVNRPRLLRPDGRSEFHDIMPLADAANKMLTDMMVSAEYHAMPRRWATGMKESDFVDETGKQLSTWDITAGNVWATENELAKMGQFPEAQLSNFHETIKLLAQLASQQLALPPHYLSFVGDNPASADAIRSSETQLVKRVERKQTYLGGAWEDVIRLVLAIQGGGRFDPAARSLETLWRDPSTPTDAQKADAVVKKVQSGIIPVEQAREDLGYSPTQRERMAEMDLRAANDPIVAQLAKNLTAPPAAPVPAALTTAGGA